MPLSPRHRAAPLLLAGSALVILLVAGRPALAACGDGILDPGEQCDDGNLLDGDCCSAACLIEPAGTVCRLAAGPCDAAEACDGSSPACPPDTVRPSGTICRPSVTGCDLAERCDGSSRSCPSDALAPAGAVCREAVDDCDLAETCNGVSSACPADARKPDGTLCNDGHGCTGPDVCQGGVCIGALAVENCADDYLRYKTFAATGFVPVMVHLVDEFEDVTAEVLKGNGISTPAQKNDQQPLDSTTHLQSYVIRSTTPPGRQTRITVLNEIGSVLIDTRKADVLLVPTAESLTAPPPPPGGNNVDSYKCYRAKTSLGTAPFAPARVSVKDEFTTTTELFDLRRPRHLCNPVDKDGQGIKNPDAHLLCYQARPAPGEPKFTPIPRVLTSNELGVSVLKVVRESELCVPSITNRTTGAGS